MTIRSHMTAIWQCHMAYGNMAYCVLLESLIGAFNPNIDPIPVVPGPTPEMFWG